MKRAIVGLAVAFVLGLTGWLLFGKDQPRPETTFTLMSGQKISTADLKGKVVLVNFWATNCPACVKEMPELARLYEEYGQKGLELIAVAMDFDSPAFIQAFIDKHHLPFPVAYDSRGRNSAAFGNVQVTPTLFLLDKQGALIRRFLGPPAPAELKKLIDEHL